MGRLFDHGVGAGEQCWWQSKTEDLGSRQIDDKLEFSWLLDWKIARLYCAESYRHIRLHSETALNSLLRTTSKLPLRRIP